MSATETDPIELMDRCLRIWEACNNVVATALAARYTLLDMGIGSDHEACIALDAVASEWAARAEAQRRATLHWLAGERP